MPCRCRTATVAERSYDTFWRQWRGSGWLTVLPPLPRRPSPWQDHVRSSCAHPGALVSGKRVSAGGYSCARVSVRRRVMRALPLPLASDLSCPFLFPVPTASLCRLVLDAVLRRLPGHTALLRHVQRVSAPAPEFTAAPSSASWERTYGSGGRRAELRAVCRRSEVAVALVSRQARAQLLVGSGYIARRTSCRKL